jgi:zinc protease
MREGTTSRTADQLTNDLSLLGTGIAFGVGNDTAVASFSTLVTNFDRSMDLMMDMMLHATYPAEALERLRTSSLVNFQNGQDAAPTVAMQVAPRLLYGDQPYGQVLDEAAIRGVTRDQIAELARLLFVPANATVYVVGDMTRLQAKTQIERGFKNWPRGAGRPAFVYPAAPVVGPTTIYLVDVPNKPQSYLRLVRAIPPAFGPDYARIAVANYVLGAGLQSRLNANIRETHGFSYGFNSQVQSAKGPGMFAAYGSVTREKTDSSVIEAMKEIRNLGTTRPPSELEMKSARSYLTLSLPSRLQSNTGILGVVARLVDENLPRDWWAQYIAAVKATTVDDVTATSRKYFDPDHMIIVVAGDAAKITEGLKAAGVAPIVKIDKAGKKMQ